MKKQRKHCNNCHYSYYRTEGRGANANTVTIPIIIHAAYSRKMLMEDWGRFCRFWAPRQKNK